MKFNLCSSCPIFEHRLTDGMKRQARACNLSYDKYAEAFAKALDKSA